MAVVRMRFTGSGAGKTYIDIAKALSLQERRLHRQKKLYTVYGGYFVDGSQNAGAVSRVNLNTAPNTWVTRTAVNRSFRIWKRMVSETLKQTEGLKPGKYNDFKLYLNNNHGDAPMLPKDANGQNLYLSNAPEWDYSTLTSADPAETGQGNSIDADAFELKIVGEHGGAVQNEGNTAGWTRIGVVRSWLDSRPRISDAQPEASVGASADPLANLFDTGDVDDDRITIIESEGDQAPYDEVSMFGMNHATTTGDYNLQRQSVATSTKEMPVAPVHGFQALCGLIQVDCTSADGDWELVLDVESVGDEF
ncbi:MAG: hypothetical protein [Circular genetic element sp.]|nr:MAG: hypothetical protein [Circular genetic element sp.]